MSSVEILSNSQFQTVYNVFSFALASMLFTSIFLLVSQPRVLPRYRQALVVSATVCGIAVYHYIRIFNSFNEAYAPSAIGGDYHLTPFGFNEAYRYVDWLLTVPLLLLETVAVLALPKATRASLLTKLIPASALMIALGYPGEIAADTAPKTIRRSPPRSSKRQPLRRLVPLPNRRYASQSGPFPESVTRGRPTFAFASAAASSWLCDRFLCMQSGKERCQVCHFL